MAPISDEERSPEDPPQEGGKLWAVVPVADDDAGLALVREAMKNGTGKIVVIPATPALHAIVLFPVLIFGLAVSATAGQLLAAGVGVALIAYPKAVVKVLKKLNPLID